MGQVLRAQFDEFGDFAQQLPLECTVGQGIPQGPGIAGQVRPAFSAGEVAAFAGGLDQEAAQRHGLGHAAGEGVLAVLADVAVRVMFGRQEEELDAAYVRRIRQGPVEGAPRGAAAGGVAIEAEHHGIREAEQLLHVVRGAGRAQGGYRVRKTQLCERHHVHIAFGDQHVARVTNGVAGFEQAIEFMALAEYRGFGGVQVLGLLVAQHAAPEADALALDVADREHDAVAKAVVTLAVGAILALAGDDKPRFHQQWIIVVRKHAGQRTPALRGIAQAEVFCDLARESATLEVVDGPRCILQLLAIGLAGLFQHVGQRGLLLPLLGRARPILRAGLILRNLQPVVLGQVAYGLDKAHAGVFHQEVDGVAMLAAAEAVVELLGGADRERRRLLGVERAQSHEIGPPLLELYVAADDLHDVDARKQLLDEGLGKGHANNCREGGPRAGQSGRKKAGPPAHQRPGRSMGRSARRQANGAVQADHLAIEHVVLEDVLGQLGIVLGRTQAAGKGDAGGQRVLHLLRHAKQHGRAEDAGSDGHVADAVASQVARDRQGHADHAALGGAVGGLADLAVVGGHRGGGDHHAAFAGGFRLVLAHGVGSQTDHVEAAHQVDHDGLAEGGQGVGAVLAHGLFGRCDACAVDQAHEFAHGDRLGDHGLRVGFLADVALDEGAADVLGHGLALVGLHVGDDDLAAIGSQHACRAFTKTRSAAGDDEYLACNLHVELLFC